jgi:hypothetical protein
MNKSRNKSFVFILSWSGFELLDFALFRCFGIGNTPSYGYPVKTPRAMGKAMREGWNHPPQSGDRYNRNDRLSQ